MIINWPFLNYLHQRFNTSSYIGIYINRVSITITIISDYIISSAAQLLHKLITKDRPQPSW